MRTGIHLPQFDDFIVSMRVGWDLSNRNENDRVSSRRGPQIRSARDITADGDGPKQ